MINLTGPPFHIDPTILNGYLDDPKLHIAATAQKKSGFCVDFLSRRNMSYKRIADICDIVNDKKEVGTLYPSPAYRFTLFPLSPTPGAGLPEKYLDDIFLAHNLYYNSANKLLFIFDATSNYDIDMARKDIEGYINERFSQPDKSWMANIVYFISAFPPAVL